MDAAGPALPTSATDADALAARFPTAAATPLRVSTKLADIAGKHLVGWTERGYCLHDKYDTLRRLTQVHITHPGDADEPATDYVSERLVYGEDLDAEDARDRNLRGQLWCLYDGAGKVESLQHDYRGQLTEAARRLPKVHVTAPDWDGTAPNEALLLDEVFSTTTVYDALGRVVEAEAPQTTGNTVVNAATTHARRTRYLYHEGGALRGVEARYEGDAAGTWRPYVTDIRYNARGQRMGVDYASGAKTHYDYDPKTFRLTELKHTVVVTETVAGEPTSVTKTAMHCTYTYDPVGNLVQIDDALDAGETRVLAGLADTASKYRYDALYRLVEAIGREHPDNEQPDPTPDGPGNGGLHPNDLTALEGYTESYSYDAVGNFTEMQHAVPAGSGAGWTRVYDYTTDTNRLRRTRAPSEPSGSVDDYGYDAHGNMTRMPHLAEMKWDAYEQMVNVRKGVGSDYIRVRCQYDAQGQRVRKVVEHYNASSSTTPVSVDERLYLGGYEVLRKHAGDSVEDDITREVQTLHVMDGEQRIVMVTTKTVDTNTAGTTAVYVPGDRQVRTRYQLGNHLGSAAIEIDGAGEVVTYEEYHPYGTCAMLYKRAGSDDEPKRYRFTGMERDETGLQYHTARFYLSWLGRWASPDPIALVDGTCTYSYRSPVGRIDPSGTQTRSLPFDGGVMQPIAAPPQVRRAAPRTQTVAHPPDRYRRMDAGVSGGDRSQIPVYHQPDDTSYCALASFLIPISVNVQSLDPTIHNIAYSAILRIADEAQYGALVGYPSSAGDRVIENAPPPRTREAIAGLRSFANLLRRPEVASQGMDLWRSRDDNHFSQLADAFHLLESMRSDRDWSGRTINQMADIAQHYGIAYSKHEFDLSTPEAQNLDGVGMIFTDSAVRALAPGQAAILGGMGHAVVVGRIADTGRWYWVNSGTTAIADTSEDLYQQVLDLELGERNYRSSFLELTSPRVMQAMILDLTSNRNSLTRRIHEN